MQMALHQRQAFRLPRAARELAEALAFYLAAVRPAPQIPSASLASARQSRQGSRSWERVRSIPIGFHRIPLDFNDPARTLRAPWGLSLPPVHRPGLELPGARIEESSKRSIRPGKCERPRSEERGLSFWSPFVRPPIPRNLSPPFKVRDNRLRGRSEND